VAIAIAVGYPIATRKARQNGVDPEQFTKLGLCVILAGFVGGHLAKFFYSADGWRAIAAHPLVLLEVLNGQASFGSFIGGYFAALAFLRWHSVPYRDWYIYAHASCFALPFAWWIGRLGCYLVHDHPGVLTSSFLGVRYPGGTRFDLGLLEALFLILLAGLFFVLDRKARPRGFYYVAFLFSYGGFRFFLDRLHVDATRYGGWTAELIRLGYMKL
jgi:phosphatidylglycerol:prolipoprotein diacylglycerol transferase